MAATDHRADDSSSNPQGATSLGAQDARQAAKTGFMRRVLTISVALAVIVMIGAWLWAYRPHASPPAQSSAPAAPILPRDQAPASSPPTQAAPQSSQPLP